MLENSEDPDSAASDLGLHCLPMPKKWDDRLIYTTCVEELLYMLNNHVY